jgi:uncharacterized membrane protein (GlpM family)
MSSEPPCSRTTINIFRAIVAILYVATIFIMWCVVLPRTDEKLSPTIVFSLLTIVLIVAFVIHCYMIGIDMYTEYQLRKSMYSLDIFGETDENTPLV